MFTNIGSPPLTKFQAPFPAWKNKDIQLVEYAISSAWKILTTTPSQSHVLADAQEVNISIALIEILEALLNAQTIKGFTGRRFSPPIRGQELEDVDGKKLEMRPDISIRLLTSQPCTQHNALFLECKRISPTRSVSDYVNEGLVRFCDQRYAWGMPHAGMLAYVQNLNPAPTAKTALDKHWAKNPTSVTRPGIDMTVESHNSISVGITKHTRQKPLPSGEPSAEITIRHLWLSA